MERSEGASQARGEGSIPFARSTGAQVKSLPPSSPIQAELLDRRPPDQPTEVAALQVGAPAAREHQPIQLGSGEIVQVLGQGGDRLSHLLDHIDASAGQVDAAAAEPDQLPQRSPP